MANVQERYINPNEAQRITGHLRKGNANPWQIFEPEKHYQFFRRIPTQEGPPVGLGLPLINGGLINCGLINGGL